MGFLFDRLKGRRSVPPNATFGITQVGREKLQQFSGDAKCQVLMALETHGTSDVDEIAETSGLSRGQVERIMPVLVRGGYVQFVNQAASEVG